MITDAHVCVPLLESTDLNILRGHQESGYNHILLNIGMDMYSFDHILNIALSFREQIIASDFMLMADSFHDINYAVKNRMMAVSFDLEGASPLGSRHPDFTKVEQLYSLGLRQLALSYNRNNNYCGGCQDSVKRLQPQGIELISCLQHIGIAVDCSHASHASALDIIDHCLKPALFSHSNSHFVFQHPRNITDSIVKICADNGGIVGVNGLQSFIGRDGSIDNMVDHITHLVNVAGISSVAIGLDYGYLQDVDDLPIETDTDYWWPKTKNYTNPFDHKVIAPVQIQSIKEKLVSAGFSSSEVNQITGLNHFNFIKEVCK